MSRSKNTRANGSENAPKITASNLDRVLNVHQDVPDLRDRFYEPALLDLKTRLYPPRIEEAPILDQLSEGACTGFALSGAINLLLSRRGAIASGGSERRLVSPRMLYEMARLHDEWPGEDYDGSSIRGVLKGFFHNGACSDKLAPYVDNDVDWNLTVEQSKDARWTGLGAYYRLRADIIDYHAALNEVGVVIVSANVHRGWRKPPDGKIEKSSYHEGGHAFMIVGYDENGFLIQNSWGPDWGEYDGHPGIAHWSYADWAENIVDAWVMRLSVPTPEAFDLTHTPVRMAQLSSTGETTARAPRRHDILGHFIHVDDGRLVTHGRYGTSLDNIKETADFLAEDSAKPTPEYNHILFYAHGGLNSSDSSARRIKALKEGFKRNGIYPMHFMWETGFTEEITDLLASYFKKGEQRVTGVREFTDWAIENATRGIGSALWREMKSGATKAFEKNAGGWQAAKTLLETNSASKKPKKIHLVGHSAGSIFLGEMLSQWTQMADNVPQLASVSLMAPACTLEFYEKSYRPLLEGNAKSRRISSLWQYSLTDSREQDDDSISPYGKSLLYLVSNAFEALDETPLLGMERFLNDFSSPNAHKIWFAGRHGSHTDSKSHGGFDNDRATMNDILKHVHGALPAIGKRFQAAEMKFEHIL